MPFSAEGHLQQFARQPGVHTPRGGVVGGVAEPHGVEVVVPTTRSAGRSARFGRPAPTAASRPHPPPAPRSGRARKNDAAGRRRPCKGLRRSARPTACTNNVVWSPACQRASTLSSWSVTSRPRCLGGVEGRSCCAARARLRSSAPAPRAGRTAPRGWLAPTDAHRGGRARLFASRGGAGRRAVAALRAGDVCAGVVEAQAAHRAAISKARRDVMDVPAMRCSARSARGNNCRMGAPPCFRVAAGVAVSRSYSSARSDVVHFRVVQHQSHRTAPGHAIRHGICQRQRDPLAAVAPLGRGPGGDCLHQSTSTGSSGSTRCGAAPRSARQCAEPQLGQQRGGCGHCSGSRVG